MKRLIFLQIFILFLFPLLSLAAPPTEANRFFIVNPDDSIVGTPVTVTIEARRGNNIDTNYQNDVALVTSGSATGGGLVDIINGVGTIQINDLTEETVILSLSDTQSTGLDVSSTQDVIFSETGGAVLNQQKLWFRDDDGDEVTASGYGADNANQNASISNVAPGISFRLRFTIKLTETDGSIVPRLEFKEGTDCTTGSWTVITPASSVFNLQSSQNFIDGDSTTQQLVGGPNFIAGQILESTNPAVSLNMLKNQSTEYEWSLKSADNISLGTTHSFRITNNGTALNSYDQCPSLTTQSLPEPPPSEPPPPESSPSGGAIPISATFSGKAFPDSRIFIIGKDLHSETILSQDIITAEDGTFRISFRGIWQDRHSFGLVIKDKEGRAAQTKFFDMHEFPDFAVKDIFVPPTVGILERLVTRGHNATVTGYASPNSNVVVEIDDIMKKEVKADKDGVYKVGVETGPLEFSSHHIRAKQIDLIQKRESDFSPTQVLTVSKLTLPKVDLSGDGRIDIKDWSMFLSQWSSKDMEKKKIIDFNDDGKVDISDFSIFIRTIKK